MIREKAEPQIYTLIAIKSRLEITPSTPAKCCKHLRNKRKSPILSPVLTIKSAGLAWARQNVS